MNDDSQTVQDDNIEVDPMDERICQNCSYFFHHCDDDDSMGICSLDEAFGAYWEDEKLMENNDFSCCRELYLQKRFNGLREACDAFESTMMDIPEGMSVESFLRLEALKEVDTSDLFRFLNRSDRKSAIYALNDICYLARKGNEEAFVNLIRFCMELGPATSLDEVAFRIKLVEVLSHMPNNEQIVNVYVQELARTPSNNMTRRLYTAILKALGQYPKEEILAPIEKLLNQTKYSYKIKRRIKEVAGLVEPENYDGDFPFFML